MKTIKILSFFISILFLNIGCQQQVRPTKERYVKEFDTVYKVNSFDIDYITRTFYKYGTHSKTELTQKVGDEVILFTTSTFKNNTMTDFISIDFENESKFLDFLNLADSLHANINKELRFDINTLTTMSTSSSGDNVILHSPEKYGLTGGLYYLNKSEIDSIRLIYNEYKSESE